MQFLEVPEAIKIYTSKMNYLNAQWEEYQSWMGEPIIFHKFMFFAAFNLIETPQTFKLTVKKLSLLSSEPKEEKVLQN